ncbi:MAG: putative phosphohistidine phosphatase, SixA [Chlorobi bacterium]|nr:putative phosphohistidine phosphatase, SixA [Chlorobiota bacterium]
MLIYLMRHGIAEETSSQGDAGRELTQQGTLRTAMVAKGLHKAGLTFDRIISSPYLRARQTAEIVSRITGHDQEILFDQRLLPQGRYPDVSDLIKENNDIGSLLLTGHEPSMGGFISGICAGGQLSVDVKKASVTAIELYRFSPSVTGSLLWMLPPGILEGISQ